MPLALSTLSGGLSELAADEFTVLVAKKKKEKNLQEAR